MIASWEGALRYLKLGQVKKFHISDYALLVAGALRYILAVTVKKVFLSEYACWVGITSVWASAWLLVGCAVPRGNRIL